MQWKIAFHVREKYYLTRIIEFFNRPRVYKSPLLYSYVLKEYHSYHSVSKMAYCCQAKSYIIRESVYSVPNVIRSKIEMYTQISDRVNDILNS